MTNSFLGDNTGKSASVKREILRLCITHNNYSIADFSRALGISVPTITKFISELIDENFLKDEGKVGTSGGRRPSVYGLNPDAGYFVGVDVARHHFHIAISDFKGKVISYIQDIEFVLEANENSFRTMCRMVIDQVTASGIPWIKVLGVGVSLSGRVNPEKGYSLTYFVSDDLPLGSIFRKEFNVPVTIENDSRAMAYGEFMHLGKKADPDMIFINVSWGLGMGIIMDGRLYYGKSGYSGELGHFPVLNNDVICRCGKVGCLETGASGLALHRLIGERLAKGSPSILSAAYAARKDITLNDILDAVVKEDVTAIECVEEVGNTLGRAVAGLINNFNPDVVVVGGRLSVTEQYLMPPLLSAVNRLSLNLVNNDTVIKVSRLGNKAGAVGASLLAKHRLLNR